MSESTRDLPLRVTLIAKKARPNNFKKTLVFDFETKITVAYYLVLIGS